MYCKKAFFGDVLRNVLIFHFTLSHFFYYPFHQNLYDLWANWSPKFFACGAICTFSSCFGCDSIQINVGPSASMFWLRAYKCWSCFSFNNSIWVYKCHGSTLLNVMQNVGLLCTLLKRGASMVENLQLGKTRVVTNTHVQHLYIVLIGYFVCKSMVKIL